MNYGLQIKDDDPDAYILGGLTQLPKIVYQINGDWSSYLPAYEPQFNSFYDSYGCTVWGTQNIIETLLKRLKEKEYNFSERFNYILAGITPPGADPHYVIESVRENGLIANDKLPMTDSYEEFLKPNPMTDDLLEEGLKFPYEVRHEYVWRRPLSKEERTEKIREALQYSPLGVSVTAWNEENGVYVDNGEPNNHWCMLYAESANGWLIFDSYDQTKKTLSFDHNIYLCKRIYLQASTKLQQVSLIKQIIKKLQELLNKLRGL